MPLVRGEAPAVRDEVFAEMTFHAAYQPLRALRTERWKYIRRFNDYPHPVLANCDDSASKELLAAAGWGEQIVAPEQLYDLVLDPSEAHDLSADESRAGVLAELRGRLEEWMRATDDPLLDGPVTPPAGAVTNDPAQRSPNDPLTIAPEAAAAS
jgi:N-sulfoglucosamine sulfohydrolase